MCYRLFSQECVGQKQASHDENSKPEGAKSGSVERVGTRGSMFEIEGT